MNDSIKHISDNIDNLIRKYETRLTDSTYRESFIDVAKILVATIEAKSLFLKGHSESVAKISVQLGTRLGLSGAELYNLEVAALLHYIGKIGIRDDIFNKDGPLEAHEKDEIDRHPLIASQILSPLGSMQSVAEAIRSYREWYDGSGCPDGLAGEDIPIMSRIIAVANSIHAMRSHRAHRAPIHHDNITKELSALSGSKFDPEVVQAYIFLLGKE